MPQTSITLLLVVIVTSFPLYILEGIKLVLSMLRQWLKAASTYMGGGTRESPTFCNTELNRENDARSNAQN